MTDPNIVARARTNYETETARIESLFPERHHPSWDRLVEMAASLDGVLQCVLHWYNAARREVELGEGEWSQEDFARLQQTKKSL